MTDSIKFDLLLPFSVPIACSNIPLDLTELEKLIVDMSKTDPSIYTSNDGGWHSKAYNEPFDEIRELWNILTDLCNTFHKSIQLSGTVKISTLWFNMNYRGASNKEHDHLGSIHSGAFYIKAPKDCGDIRFQNPNQKMHWAWPVEMREKADASAPAITELSITPQVGDNYIFPSWMSHGVNGNMTDELRISLSYNTIWKPKTIAK